MESADVVRAFVSLIGVVALILLTAWVVKRVGIEKRFAGMRKDARLQIVESLYIDARHRVVILRRDTREHVLLVTATDSLVLESYDATTPEV